MRLFYKKIKCIGRVKHSLGGMNYCRWRRVLKKWKMVGIYKFICELKTVCEIYSIYLLICLLKFNDLLDVRLLYVFYYESVSHIKHFWNLPIWKLRSNANQLVNQEDWVCVPHVVQTFWSGRNAIPFLRCVLTRKKS